MVECVKASSSFPFFFDPSHIDSMIFVDGGVMNNYPIDIFDGNTLKERYGSKKVKNQKTLGFKPIGKTLIDAFESGKEPEPFIEVHDVYEHAIYVAEAVTISDALLAFNNNDRTVFIDDLNIGALKFDLTKEDRER